jgi:hypothetical protein
LHQNCFFEKFVPDKREKAFVIAAAIMIAATEAAYEIQNINLKSQGKTMKTTLKNQAKLTTISLVCGFMLAAAFPAPAQELTPVSEPPATGTFWLLSSKLNHQLSPPYPCDRIREPCRFMR